jgi:hypothetical protein
MLLIE